MNYFFGTILLLCLLGLVQSGNLVLSALLVAASVFTTSFWLASWGLDYLAVVYQLVYLGAVIVLFLFVVMFLDDARDSTAASAPLLVIQSSRWLLFDVFLATLLFAPVSFLLCLLGSEVLFSLLLTEGFALQPPVSVSSSFSVDIPQLAFMQFFFSGGSVILVLLGVLFLVALFFSVTLILFFGRSGE